MGGPLEDVSNRQRGVTLPFGIHLPLKTFSRRDRKNALETVTEAEPASPAAPVLPAVPEEEEEEDRPYNVERPVGRKGARQARPDGYSRKEVPSAAGQEAARRKEYFARMRAHFAEVDAFELAVESPAADVKRQAAEPQEAALLSLPAPSPEVHGSEAPPAMLSTPQQPRLHPLAALDEYEADSPAVATLPLTPGTQAAAPEAAAMQQRPPTGTDARRGSLATRRTETAASKAPSYGLSRRSSILRPPRPPAGPTTPATAAAAASERRSLAAHFSAGVSTALQRLSSSSLLRSAARIASPLQGRKSAAAGSPWRTRLQLHASPAAPRSALPAVEEGPDTPVPEQEGSPLQRQRLSRPSSARAGTPQADAEALAGEVAARLQLSPAAEEQPEEGPEEDLSELQQLLRACDQSVDEGAIPSMDALLAEAAGGAAVRKIGEGTFGEAFAAGGRVLKIVPLGGEQLVNGEPQKAAGEILAEVAIARTLSQLRDPQGHPDNVTAAFVETFRVGVCRGAYAPPLAAAWHAWDAAHGSENDAVDDFAQDQLFVVFAVANGGADLERADVRGFAEARSILLQSALALAVAEEACEFEHRDLHWGNILIKRGASRPLGFRLRGVDIEVDSAGVEVTLIDFTISRLQTSDGGIAFSDLEADPALFAGRKGDCQADTYRRMRKATGGDWQRFTPLTNALWLHYLADLLLTSKRCPCQPEQSRALRDFRRRTLRSGSSADIVTDDFFAGAWRSC